MKAAWVLACAVISLVAANLFAQTNVYRDGQLPNDRRLGELRHLNNYFPFEVPKTTAAWEARRDQLRTRLRVALGLWPQPAKTPLNVELVQQATYLLYFPAGTKGLIQSARDNFQN